MAEKLRKFHQRAARYILRPQDQNAMRFGLEDGQVVEQTILLNLSESGVAFLTHSNKHFSLGERLMVEIPIPGGDQLAWYARVVRIAEHRPRTFWGQGRKDAFFNDTKTLIAATFERLPEGHTRALRKGIEESFLQAMRDQRHRNVVYWRTLIVRTFLHYALYVLLTGLAFGLLYFWTRPDAHYSSERGAPWGDRFK